MSDFKYQIIRRFGPSIFKIKMPQKTVDKLNNYVDSLIKDQGKSKKLNYGEHLVGDVTQEFLLEKKIITESGWLNFLSTCVQKWIEVETGKKLTKFSLKQSWIVRQFKNEYNPTHWHGGHISGTGYLKLPKNLGKHKQSKEKREYRGGNLQLIHGSRMFLCHSTYNIVPEVGDFYFFPNYLMHTVFPFKDSDEERRSISFNASIDDNIYDVYGA